MMLAYKNVVPGNVVPGNVVPGSVVPGSVAPVTQVDGIQWDMGKHTVMIKNTKINLTKTEYRLLSPLRHGLPITYSDLAYIVYNCHADEKVRAMMDKHIDRVRGKLRGTGVYVYCVLGYGYLLFPEA